jgi:hypothetical protein
MYPGDHPKPHYNFSPGDFSEPDSSAVTIAFAPSRAAPLLSRYLIARCGYLGWDSDAASWRGTIVGHFPKGDIAEYNIFILTYPGEQRSLLTRHRCHTLPDCPQFLKILYYYIQFDSHALDFAYCGNNFFSIYGISWCRANVTWLSNWM